MSLAVLLLALQGGAPGSLTFDVRCMIALGQLARSTEPTYRQAGETGSQYYFGRIDARVRDDQLEETLLRETRGMREDQQAETLRACGAFLELRDQRLTEAGRRLSPAEGTATRR